MIKIKTPVSEIPEMSNIKKEILRGYGITVLDKKSVSKVETGNNQSGKTNREK